MPEAATKTTNPRRARSRATTPKTDAPAKPAPAQAKPRRAPAKKAAPVQASFTFDLAYIDDTKNYSRFDQSLTVDGNSTGFAANSKIYAPLGTEGVSITVTGPADVVEEVAEAATEE